MSATRDWNLDCKVYVGEIGYGTVKQDLEDVFSEYGPLKNVWVARNPPGFAFVEFEDYRDAKDAVDALDGTRINGRRARVEMSSGKSRWGSRGPPPRRGPRYGGGDRRRSRSRSWSPYSRRRSPSPSVRRRSPSPRRPRRSTSRDRSRRRSSTSRDRSSVGKSPASRNKSRSRSPYSKND